MASHLRQESSRDHHQPAQRHWRQGRDLRFQVQLFHALLEPRLQLIGATARLLRVEAGVGPTSLLLELEFLSAVVPVANLFREAILHCRSGLVNPPQAPSTHLLEVLRHDLSNSVRDRFLLQVTGDPGARGVRQQAVDVQFVGA
jgi:hypothetical protein